MTRLQTELIKIIEGKLVHGGEWFVTLRSMGQTSFKSIMSIEAFTEVCSRKSVERIVVYQVHLVWCPCSYLQIYEPTRPAFIMTKRQQVGFWMNMISFITNHLRNPCKWIRCNESECWRSARLQPSPTKSVGSEILRNHSHLENSELLINIVIMFKFFLILWLVWNS